MICKSCGVAFERKPGRGRPPLRCEPCRGIKAPAPVTTGKWGLYYVRDLLDVLEDYPDLGKSGSQEIAKVVRSLSNGDQSSDTSK